LNRREVPRSFMKEEEVDWAVYHHIAGHASVTVVELAEWTGFLPEEVESSLGRLLQALLVARGEDGTVHALSLQESLLLCEARYATDCPFTIVDGVIKLRREDS